jgi:hypothetical protein
MWTIQEVVLSRPKTLFYEGSEPDQQFRWAHLLVLLSLSNDQPRNWPEAERIMHTYSELTMHRFFLNDFQAGKKGDPSSPPPDVKLGSILTSIRSKGASDPRDKIFALHGLCSELQINTPVPDYTKSVADVYREATIACITHDQGLRHLYAVPSDRQNDLPNLASWVPNWNDKCWSFNPDISDFRFYLGSQQWRACGDALPLWSFSHGNRRLVLHGKIYDTIAGYTDTPWLDMRSILAGAIQTPIWDPLSESWLSGGETSDCLTTIYHTLRSWHHMILNPRTDPTGEAAKTLMLHTLSFNDPNLDEVQTGLFEAWYHVLTAGEDAVTALAVDRIEKTLSSIELEPEAVQSIISTFKQKSPTDVRIVLALQAAADELASTRAFSWRPVMHINKHALFVTQRGHAGMAPCAAHQKGAADFVRAGDSIALLAGLDKPMILRRCNDGSEEVYEVVGQAYVYGLMDGQGWNDATVRKRDIVLV